MAEHFHTRMTLIVRLRNKHDAKAWEDFVYYYQRYIDAVVYRLGVNKDDVQDLSQKVLLALWEKLPSFDYQPGKCKFRSWMSAIIRNHVSHYFGKQQRYVRDRNRAEQMQLNESSHEEPEIYAIAEHEWKMHITKLAWENVKMGFSAKTLRCFELFSRGEDAAVIAEKLDLKMNSVFVYRQRVREKFHQEIRRLDGELS